VNVHTLIPTAFRLETTDTEINQLNELAIFVINYLRGYEMDDTAYNKDINSIILLGNYLRFYDFQKSLPSLEALTKFTGLNRNKLQKLFREQFGKTYYQFYQEARFRFAEELITKRGYNISETARMVGFKHISHFSTYFEKIMGYRPIVLKKKTF
jgi:AraC-like DNA-binding protein